MARSLTHLERELQKFQKRYSRILEEKERMRKRRQDVHLTPKDRKILIESFVIGGVVENLITKFLSKIL